MGSTAKGVNLYWCIAFTLSCVALATHHEKLLVKTLLQNYEHDGTMARPILNATDPVKVNISFGVIELTKFDIERQELVMVGWTALEWNDAGLIWDPEEYGDTTEISLKQDDIWIPDVILVNSLSKPEPVHDTSIHVSNEGRVTYVTSHKYNFYCKIPTDKMESESFPCYMQFASWSMGDQLLDLRNKRDRFDANYYISNRDWEFYKNRAKTQKMDLPWGNGRKASQVVYDFVLKRREPLIKEEDLDNSGMKVSSSIVICLLAMLGRML